MAEKGMIAERVDRAYLERRLALCREKADAADDPGLARVYRNFADQYARALAAEPVEETSESARSFMLGQ